MKRLFKTIWGYVLLGILILALLVALFSVVVGGAGVMTGEMTEFNGKLVIIPCGLVAVFVLQLAFRQRDRL